MCVWWAGARPRWRRGGERGKDGSRGVQDMVVTSKRQEGELGEGRRGKGEGAERPQRH